MKDSKWKKILQGLRTGEKLPGKNHLLIILLAGLILFIAVLPVSQKDQDDTGQKDKDANISTDTESASLTERSYEEYLEQKTEQTLEKVEGVGRVTVMITLQSDGQKIIEKDETGSSQSTSETDSEGGERSIEEKNSQQESIFRQDSDGSSEPYVSQKLAPEVKGIVVIADGGDNAVTIQNITEAVQALFGVQAHKIKIMKRA